MKQTFNYRQKARQFFAVLLPIFITQLSLMATGFFNTVMAGHISEQDLAGVAVGVNLFMPFFGSFLGIISGLTPTISQLYGASRQDRIGFIVKQGFYWAFGLAVIFLALGWLIVPWALPLLNLEPRVEYITQHYLIAVSFGIIPIFLAGVLRNFIDAHGYTRLTMIITMCTVPTNIILNYILMYGLFGVPAFGGIGAGIGSAIALTLNLRA
jgi:MATE family multidrug resistance protein